MDKARFKIGDKIDVAHDNQLCYLISGGKGSTVGNLRFTFCSGMATITSENLANSSRVFIDDKLVNTSTGRVIFALDEKSIFIHPNSCEEMLLQD